MRKFLSLLAVPFLTFVFLLFTVSPVFAACSFTATNRIAPGGPVNVVISGNPTALFEVIINDGSGNPATPTASGGINPGESTTTITVNAPPATGFYTIEVNELGFITSPGGPCTTSSPNLEVTPDAPSVADPEKPAEIGAIVTVIKNIIGLLVPTAAIAFFIMMIVGGARFLLSGGDPKAVAGARSTLTFAIIGVILVIVSWLILLVIENVTGVGVTNVIFPTL